MVKKCNCPFYGFHLLGDLLIYNGDNHCGSQMSPDAMCENKQRDTSQCYRKLMFQSTPNLKVILDKDWTEISFSEHLAKFGLEQKTQNQPVVA
ncbi:MAG: hypothetical protein WCX73_01515 [Candidatus Pacearchaeota archaeon]|jgi:hypothetical protein